MSERLKQPHYRVLRGVRSFLDIIDQKPGSPLDRPDCEEATWQHVTCLRTGLREKTVKSPKHHAAHQNTSPAWCTRGWARRTPSLSGSCWSHAPFIRCRGEGMHATFTAGPSHGNSNHRKCRSSEALVVTAFTRSLHHVTHFPVYTNQWKGNGVLGPVVFHRCSMGSIHFWGSDLRRFCRNIGTQSVIGSDSFGFSPIDPNSNT